MQDKQFPQGIIFKGPREGAPEFIRGSLSFKVDEFIQYLKDNNNNGWVNIDIKRAKAGNLYLDLNDWKPENKQSTTPPPQTALESNTEPHTASPQSDTSEEIRPEDIPF